MSTFVSRQLRFAQSGGMTVQPFHVREQIAAATQWVWNSFFSAELCVP